MKSEREIRRHLKNLFAAVELPCGCATEGECAKNKLAMMSECVALIWVLGDHPGAGMHQEIKAMHAGSN